LDEQLILERLSFEDWLGCRDDLSNELEPDERRLSSVTIVKSAPFLDASFLPDVSHLMEDLELDCDLSPARGEVGRTLAMEQVC
jgi:hypothetical protein